MILNEGMYISANEHVRTVYAHAQIGNTSFSVWIALGSSEWVNGFNVIYKQFIAMYDGGCPICCNWARREPGFVVQHTELPYHR